MGIKLIEQSAEQRPLPDEQPQQLFGRIEVDNIIKAIHEYKPVISYQSLFVLEFQKMIRIYSLLAFMGILMIATVVITSI